MYFSAPESAVELFSKLRSVLQALYILSVVKSVGLHLGKLVFSKVTNGFVSK